MNKTRIKTIIGIVLALVLVLLLTSQIFWGNTPRFHPLLWSRIKSFPNKVISLPGKVISLLPNPFKKQASLDDFSAVTPPSHVQFKQAAPGVKRGTDAKTNTEYVTYEAGVELEITTYVLEDGSEVSVLMPKK